MSSRKIFKMKMQRMYIFLSPDISVKVFMPKTTDSDILSPQSPHPPPSSKPEDFALI